MKRQADGRWRSPGQPMIVSQPVLRARWVEAETLRLKQMGVSFEAIAEQITRIGLGQAAPLIALPEGVTFPPGYRITKQGCHKALRKALAREPSLEVEELRKLDNARCEEMYMSLQPAIRTGNARSIESARKLLDHAARINGNKAPQKHELTGKDGQPLTLLQVLKVIEGIPDED